MAKYRESSIYYSLALALFDVAFDKDLLDGLVLIDRSHELGYGDACKWTFE